MDGVVHSVHHPHWTADYQHIVVSVSKSHKFNVGDKVAFGIVSKPPKTYTFTEAYQMMKQGKRMAPYRFNGELETTHDQCFRYDGYWKQCSLKEMVPFNSTNFGGYFSASDIEAQWIEVKP